MVSHSELTYFTHKTTNQYFPQVMKKSTLCMMALAVTLFCSCSNEEDFGFVSQNAEEICQVANGTHISLPNGMTVVKEDSFYIFQGDIYYTEEDIREMLRVSRGSFDMEVTKWESTIPYAVDSRFSKTAELAMALQHWTEATNIRFIPRTNEDKYIFFSNSSDGTNHTAGRGKPTRIFNHKRNIYINETAVAGNIIHEIGHALGLTHEQCRADRDNYIRIMTDNIISSKLDQYEVYNGSFCSQYTKPFDFNSIMMYPAYNEHAINDNFPVMVDVNDPTHTQFGGQRYRLSEEDRALFNRYLYRNERHYISGIERIQAPSQSTYTATVPANSSVYWSVSPSNGVSIIAGQSTNSVTLKFTPIIGNTEYCLHAQIITPLNYLWDKYFYISASAGPVVQDILMYKYCQGDGEYTLEARVTDKNSTITWNSDGTIYDIIYPDDALFLETPNLFKAVDFYSSGTHFVEATATNSSGSNTLRKSFTINDSKSRIMTLSPNPATTDFITVQIENLENVRKAYHSDSTPQINIYSHGKKVYSCEMASLKQKVELPNLENGQYVVEYDDGNNNKIRQMLIINKKKK